MMLARRRKILSKSLQVLEPSFPRPLTPAVAAVGAAVFLATEEMDKAFGIIQTGTGASGEALEGLKDDFKALNGSVVADGTEIATVIADLNTRLGLTGETLQKAARAALDAGIDVNALAQTMEIFGEGCQMGNDLYGPVLCRKPKNRDPHGEANQANASLRPSHE